MAGRYADLYQILLFKKSDATVIVIYQVCKMEKKKEPRQGEREGGRRNLRWFKFDKEAVLPFR